MNARTVASRLVQIAALLFALSFALFGVLSLLPGDPVDLLVLSNPNVRPEDVAALKEQRGLDRPWPVRWWRWVAGSAAPRTPPRAPVLSPLLVDLDETGAGVAVVVVPLTTGETLRGPPSATVRGDTLTLPVMRAGVHRVPFAVQDAFGLEDAGAVTIYGVPPPPIPAGKGDDPHVIDGTDERQQGGSNESPQGASTRTDADRIAAARAAGAIGVEAIARTFAKGTALAVAPSAWCGAAPCTLHMEATPFALLGRTVRFGEVDKEGVLVPIALVVDHGAVADPARFERGAAYALLGDPLALGWSQTYRRPVWELLFGPAPTAPTLAARVQAFGRVQNTLMLMGPAMLFAALLSLLLGTAAAARPGGVVDRAVGGLSIVGAALPAFWIGIMAIVVFAGTLRLLPAGGAQTPGLSGGLVEIALDRARHMVLPVLVLALAYTAQWLRTVRASVLEVMPQLLVRTARAKGASPARVLWHALSNALLPFVNVVALSVPAVFSGAVLTETVFSWPGVGRLQYEAILNNDSYVAIVVFLVSAALVMCGTLCADVLSALLDPRLRARGRR